MSKTYSEKLKDPRWQRKRLEILNRDNFTCLKCESKVKTLHVHHGYYKSGFEPWDYPNETLQTLCECCHIEIEELKQDLYKEISKTSFDDMVKAFMFIKDLNDYKEFSKFFVEPLPNK